MSSDVDEVLGHEVEPRQDAPDEAGADEAGDAAHERADQVVGRARRGS